MDKLVQIELSLRGENPWNPTSFGGSYWRGHFRKLEISSKKDLYLLPLTASPEATTISNTLLYVLMTH